MNGVVHRYRKLMKNLKAKQKYDLMYEFAILMQPLEDLARAPQPPSASAWRIAIAKVQAGDVAWRRMVREFSTFASDIILNQENSDISHVPEHCLRDLMGAINNPTFQENSGGHQEVLNQRLKSARHMLFEFVDRIPIEWEPEVFEANTPFTSYLKIKYLIVSAKQRLHYFDRYLRPEFFTLFLPSVDRNISIRLVTTSGDRRYGVVGVEDVSALAYQEFTDYQLVEVSSDKFHDRNLRVDEQIFSLGPGVDRAGIALTNFGPSDNSPIAHEAFDRLIRNGREVH